MDSLKRFRVVKLDQPWQECFSLPDFICVDADGMPFPAGQNFYAWCIDDDKNDMEAGTARNYLTAVLAFLTFLYLEKSLTYCAGISEIRRAITIYLRIKLGCSVRPHRGGNWVVRPGQQISSSSIRICLVALRHFYRYLIQSGIYDDPNPLIWVEGVAARQRNFRPQMPPRSGLTLPQKRDRQPDTFFCVISGEWRPQTIQDSALPLKLLPHFTCQRDRIIAEILFAAGPRIQEVLDLTMGDWSSLGQGERILATNKGSHGARVKELWLPSSIVGHLLRYINTERKQADTLHRDINQLPDSALIFINNSGQEYTYHAFRKHWRAATEKAGIRLRIHQARHWFVTMSLHVFDRYKANDRDNARRLFITHMHWTNRETIEAYDHRLPQTELTQTLNIIGDLVTGNTITNFVDHSLADSQNFDNPRKIPSFVLIPDKTIDEFLNLIN